jgi:DNA-binding CsgD family transcriptional regulator
VIYEKLHPSEIRAADTLCMLAKYGMNCKSQDVANVLGISKATVKQHLSQAMEKTGFFDRINFILAWRCEIFQIGLRHLGMIPK